VLKKIIHLQLHLLKILLLTISCAFVGGASFASSNSIEGIQVYQQPHLSTLSIEKKQKLADDIVRYQNADNLWDVLREEFSLSHYENTPEVQAQIEWFMGNQEFLLHSASRAAPYLYYILQQVRKRHLPAELALIPMIESGYNPFAYSSAGAAGIWQMMPGTASGYGIKQDWWYDGRRDVVASTRAALNHLSYLRSFFDGNWLLAIAAYDTGEGNVLSAIRRNIRVGKNTEFWSLPVAQETKAYVPRLLALATIISHPEQYPIYFPPVQNAPYLAQVDVNNKVHLKTAAALAGISFKKLLQLNSGFNRPATAPKGPYKLVLPIENVEQFVENLARSPLSQPVDWLHYKVKSGDTLASVSKKFGVTPEAIRKMNRLGSQRLKSKMNLLIPHDGSSIVAKSTEEPMVTSKTMKDKSAPYHLQPGDTIYMVRAKDSLPSIARRFHIDSQSLQTANHLSSGALKPGKQLIIPTHQAAAKSKKIHPGDMLYMVRRGDNIEKIAKKFHTTPAQIRVANLMDSHLSLHEGERLIVPTSNLG